MDANWLHTLLLYGRIWCCFPCISRSPRWPLLLEYFCGTGKRRNFWCYWSSSVKIELPCALSLSFLWNHASLLGRSSVYGEDKINNYCKNSNLLDKVWPCKRDHSKIIFPVSIMFFSEVIVSISCVNKRRNSWYWLSCNHLVRISLWFNFIWISLWFNFFGPLEWCISIREVLR